MNTVRVATQQGFTAVELLITLLITAMFLFSGYQLYSAVSREGLSANKAARLSGIVSEKVSAKVASGTACGATITPNPEVINEPIIGSVSYAYSITCPNSSVPTLRLVKVTATYESGTKKVEHAVYAN